MALSLSKYLELPKLILKNANDIATSFFNNITVDFENYDITGWVKKKIPDVQLSGDILENIKRLGRYAYMSKSEIKRLEVKDKADKIIYHIKEIGELTGFNKHFNFGKYQKNISEKTIYETIKDRILLYRQEYRNAAALVVAAAIARYLYKLYRGGVSPNRIKTKANYDSKLVRNSAATAATAKSNSSTVLGKGASAGRNKKPLSAFAKHSKLNTSKRRSSTFHNDANPVRKSTKPKNK